MAPSDHAATCPACGSPDVEWVSDGEVANFVCLACWRCWHPELGWVRRVDPSACPGCHYRDRCLALASTDPNQRHRRTS
jgi:NMD protein affecting ribosome stability and mRNA decay